MAFEGRHSVRSKIVIDNTIIEEINSFNCLGDFIAYEKEVDVDNNLNNQSKIAGIINNMFRPQKTLKKTRIKLYNALALPALLDGTEYWIIKARDGRIITTAEMKYMRRTSGYISRDYKTNTEIVKGINIILRKTYVKYLKLKLYDKQLHINTVRTGDADLRF